MVKRLFVVLYLATAMVNTASSQTERGVAPRGIVALCPRHTPIPQAVLENPSIAGVAIRLAFKDIEPVEGTFQWGEVAQKVEAAKRAGKFVVLHVLDGSKELPDWLLGRTKNLHITDTNAYHQATYGRQIEVPVFWDPELLRAKTAFYAALSKRLGNDPAVRVVGVAFANWYWDDWFVPFGEAAKAAWAPVGYSPEKLISAGKIMIDSTMTDLPGKLISLPVNETRLDRDMFKVAREVVAYANERYPGRLLVSNFRFSAIIPSAQSPRGIWSLIAANSPMVAGQALWYVSGDNTYRMNGKTPGDEDQIFRETLSRASSYNLRYFEVYMQDLMNPKFTTMLTDYAHRTSR